MPRATREQVQLIDPPMTSGSGTSDATKPVKTLVVMDNVLTTLLQQTTSCKTLMLGLPKLNLQSNVGHVLERRPLV